MALSLKNITDSLSDLTGSNQVPNNKNLDTNGFSVPSVPSGDGFGLQSSKVGFNRSPRAKRNIMHWFVPEVGVVDMYINPSSVNYSFSKLLTEERTKGGYVIQYWGEQLPQLTIAGSTGTSGVEGINVLYEIYRSEQSSFDAIGLTLASNNFITGLADSLSQDSILGSLTAGILDVNPLAQSVLPKSLPSLASIALGIELYWSGWVFRGFFKSFQFDEKADALGLFNYTIQFSVTQRRGYRYNFMPWHHTAVEGPSNHDTIPYSFDDTSARNGRR